jgi:O-antigen/teichoic acid export membrane protein
MHLHSGQFLNIGLRVSTLATRFIFIFFIAKYLDPASVGYYGIFTATIGYSLYFVGLDFHSYLTREIIKAPKHQRGQMIKGHAALSGIMCFLLIPVTLAFLSQVEWPGYLIWWFFPILLLEYINQECSRLLTTLSEQITASMILFVRQGSWAIASVLLMGFHSSSRNLDTVMALWVISGIVAAAIGVFKVKKLYLGGWLNSIDWQWIKKGILISGVYLLASLALRGITTLDRYWLEDLGGIEMVGAYVLLIGIASTLWALLDAGVFVFAYPMLIKYYNEKKYDDAKNKVNQVILQTLVLSVAFSLFSWIFLPYLLGWIGNRVYIDSINLYPWLLLANILYSLGMAPHYGLYAQGKDKHIIYSQGTSLILFATSIWILSDSFGPMSIVLSLNLSYALIFIWKIAAYFIIMKNVKV